MNYHWLDYGVTSFKNIRQCGFSMYEATKSKYQNRMDVTSNMRIQLSTITPNFQRPAEKRKHHHSSY
jgi:hypothetical protein